jgi:hypothetical protein
MDWLTIRMAIGWRRRAWCNPGEKISFGNVNIVFSLANDLISKISSVDIGEASF